MLQANEAEEQHGDWAEWARFLQNPSTWNSSPGGIVDFNSTSPFQNLGTTTSLNRNLALSGSGQSLFTPESGSRAFTPWSSRTPSCHAAPSASGINGWSDSPFAGSQRPGLTPGAQSMLELNLEDSYPMSSGQSRARILNSITSVGKTQSLSLAVPLQPEFAGPLATLNDWMGHPPWEDNVVHQTTNLPYVHPVAQQTPYSTVPQMLIPFLAANNPWQTPGYWNNIGVPDDVQPNLLLAGGVCGLPTSLESAASNVSTNEQKLVSGAALKTRKRKASLSVLSSPSQFAPKKPRKTRHKLIKSCRRCHRQKLKCDDAKICGRCVEVGSTLRKYEPCYRDDLEKVITFRDGNSRAKMTSSVLPILQWASNESASRTIMLSFPCRRKSAAGYPQLSVLCREFVPQEGKDILVDVWEGDNGERLILEFPAWALWQTDVFKESLSKYIDSCTDFFESDLSTEETDSISVLTIQEALRFSSLLESGRSARDSPSMLSMALKIRRIAYFCRESMTITSDDTLGIAKIRNQGLPSLYDTVPVPSVLDFQIDTIAILLMRELLQETLAKMNKNLFAINSDGKENWYEVFLVCFVLLSSLEKVYELQLKYLGWNDKMEELTYRDIEYHTRTMISQWKHSADVILKHFRCVVFGMTAFSLPWDEQDVEIPFAARKNVDDEGKRYLCTLKGLLAEKDRELRSVKEQYGQLYVWRSRLFLDDDSVL